MIYEFGNSVMIDLQLHLGKTKGIIFEIEDQVTSRGAFKTNYNFFWFMNSLMQFSIQEMQCQH